MTNRIYTYCKVNKAGIGIKNTYIDIIVNNTKINYTLDTVSKILYSVFTYHINLESFYNKKDLIDDK